MAYGYICGEDFWDCGCCKSCFPDGSCYDYPDIEEEDWIMAADRFYAEHALTAVNVGVVIHASEGVDNPFTDMQWEED